MKKIDDKVEADCGSKEEGRGGKEDGSSRKKKVVAERKLSGKQKTGRGWRGRRWQWSQHVIEDSSRARTVTRKKGGGGTDIDGAEAGNSREEGREKVMAKKRAWAEEKAAVKRKATAE